MKQSETVRCYNFRLAADFLRGERLGGIAGRWSSAARTYEVHLYRTAYSTAPTSATQIEDFPLGECHPGAATRVRSGLAGAQPLSGG